MCHLTTGFGIWLILCLLPAPARAQEPIVVSPTLQEVISLLQEREERFPPVDFLYSETIATGKDAAAFQAASFEFAAASLKAMGLPWNGPAASPPPPPPFSRTFWGRVRYAHRARFRWDQFAGAPTAGKDDWTVSMGVDGDLREIARLSTTFGLAVTSASSLTDPVQLDVIGLALPERLMPGSVSWSKYLEKVQETGVVESVQSIATADGRRLRMIAGVPSGLGQPDRIYERIELILDQDRGWAPIVLESQMTVLVDGKLLVPEASQSQRVEWSRLEHFAEGVWISREMKILSQADAYLISPGQQLTLTTNARGEQAPDCSGLKVKRFTVNEMRYELPEAPSLWKQEGPFLESFVTKREVFRHQENTMPPGVQQRPPVNPSQAGNSPPSNWRIFRDGSWKQLVLITVVTLVLLLGAGFLKSRSRETA